MQSQVPRGWMGDKRTITATFAAALLIVLAIGAASYRTTRELLAAMAARNDTHRVIEKLQTLLTQLDDAETGQRGYLITGEASYLEPYQEANGAVQQTVKSLEEMTAADEGQQRRLESLRPLVNAKLSELAKTIERRRTGGFAPAQEEVLSNLGKRLMDEIRAVVAQMGSREEDYLNQSDRDVAASERRALVTLLVGNALAFALLLLVFFLLNREIALRKQAEEEMRRLNRDLELRSRELEATNKELEAFTYSVSHDLRAPLRHIDGFGKLLTEEFGPQLPEEAQRYLQRVRDGTRQMGQLVDDLLNLARVGRKELSLQVTGLKSLVEQVVAEQKADTADRRIEWKLAPLPFVECDPALMMQVFANLISNAVKYTRPRERAVIEVGTLNQNGQPAIFVKDNGVGFSMKYADKLFGVFQRLHRPEDFEGTGVGLATVQRIVHKHGGRVWAEAELDQGATFFFTLGKDEISGRRTQPAAGGKA